MDGGAGSVDGGAEAAPTAEGPVAETSAAKVEATPAVLPVVPPAVVTVAAPEATAPATKAPFQDNALAPLVFTAVFESEKPRMLRKFTAVGAPMLPPVAFFN